MGIIAWIILGLVAGAIAKAILPGRQGGGWIATLLLGIVGAFVGGFIANALFHLDVNNSITNIWTWIFAIIGGIIVAAIWQWITGRSGTRTRA